MSGHPVGMDYPHGTYLAYQHRPCRCRSCTNAWALYAQRLKLRHDRGQVWADLDHYRTVLAPIVAAGVAPSAIAHAAGIGQATAQRLVGVRDGRVRADTAAKVDGFTLDDLDDSTFVDAALLRREVARMRRHGATNPQLAARLGWSSWPGDDYPANVGQAQLGTVRRARLAADMWPHAPSETCEDCDADTPLWLRWCRPCGDRRTLPQKPRELEDARRRREARRRRQKYRRSAA